MSNVVPLRPEAAAGPTSRELADRLLTWHAEFVTEIERNDRAAEDFERRADQQAIAARNCAAEAVEWLDREPETYFALMGCSARFLISARILRARAQELRI